MTLTMMQLALDPQRLHQWLHSRKLLHVDPGYQAHTLLTALFGGAAPQPFRLREQGAALHVLSYTSGDPAALHEAHALAEPLLSQAVTALASKPMPGLWRSGAQYAFEVRACPTVRFWTDDGRQAECDAFTAAVRKAASPATPVNRTAVYGDWLRQKMAAAAELETATVAGFQLFTPHRRNTDRALVAMNKARRCPDALFQGVLRVTDPDAFAALLARGIGRHRAFGFGMLLVKPVL